MGADSAQHTGQRKIFHDDFKGLFVLAHLDHVDIALNIQTAGTGQTAGGFVAFVNGKGAGNGLGILFVGRFFRGQAFLILIGQIYGAHLGALSAARAFVKINIAGVFSNPGFKISRFALQV